MRRDLAIFLSWVAVLALCLYFGPIARPWFDGPPGVYAAWIMGLVGVGVVGAGLWLWLRLPIKQRRRSGWGLLAVTLGLVFLAWLQPLLIERSHLIMYGVLGVLSWRVLGHWLNGGRRLLCAVFLASSIGWLDELGQWLHPDRVFDWRDVGTNTVAGVFGALAAWLLEHRQ
jgi:hypothetical protein